MAFLRREIESMLRVAMKQVFVSDHETVHTANCLLSQEDTRKPQISCLWCEKTGHSNLECYKLHNLTIEERWNIVMKKRACHICLKRGHHSKSCKAAVKCFICKKRHSTALCRGEENKKEHHTQHNHPEKSKTTTCLSTQHYNTETLLQTVVIYVRNGERVLPVRALFDSGSQRSYLREDVAKKLDLTATGQEKLNHCLFGNVMTNVESRSKYNVFIESLESSFKFNIEALSQISICGNIPKLNLNCNMNNILKRHNITLSDANCNINEIGILIGADFAGYLLTSRIIVLENGLAAIKTKLGWVIQGKQICTLSCSNSSTMSCVSVSNSNLADFWILEALGIHDPAETQSRAEGEAEALSNFEKNVRILPPGRYEVELPFKMSFDDLLPNYEMAKKRLDSNTKKLSAAGKFHDYDAILREWLTLGIIEKSPSDKCHSSNLWSLFTA